MKSQILDTKAQEATKPRKRAEYNGVTEEYLRMFSALGGDTDSLIDKQTLLDMLKESGICAEDPRISSVITELYRSETPTLDFSTFQTMISSSSSILKNVIQKRLVIPDFADFEEEMTAIFETLSKNKEGHVADYIPQLGRVDPEQFGLAVTTISGQRFSIGDSKTPFCLQSVNKPINYCLALEEHGHDKVRQHIGREPSGKGFNELSLNDDGLPHNPMINAGAIMCSALIRSNLNLADRFDYILQAWRRLSGGANLNFNNPVYLSERETADRNFALGYFMREQGAFPEGTNLVETLEFYFQCCAIEANAESLSVVAASLAHGGVCPTTGEKVFDPITAQRCLSLMASCGMYNYSGEFAFRIGLPSKSGVSGAIMVIVPNVMGMAVWSPRLDRHGNSVRGIKVCQQMVEKYNFHVYESVLVNSSMKKDPRLKKNLSQIEGVIQLCWAASQGDLTEVQNLVASGISPNLADYDGRTALHLASAEGHLDIIQYLLTQNAKVNVVDRWGNTPLKDAQRGNKKAATIMLKKAGSS